MSLPTKAVLYAATYPRDPKPGAPCNITIGEFDDWLAEQLRQAQEAAWLEGALHGSDMGNDLHEDYFQPQNPYRSQP